MRDKIMKLPVFCQQGTQDAQTPWLSISRDLLMTMCRCLYMTDDCEKGGLVALNGDTINHFYPDATAVPTPHAYHPSDALDDVLNRWLSEDNITHWGMIHTHTKLGVLSCHDINYIQQLFLLDPSLEVFYAGLVVGNRQVCFWRFDRDAFTGGWKGDTV